MLGSKATEEPPFLSLGPCSGSWWRLGMRAGLFVRRRCGGMIWLQMFSTIFLLCSLRFRQLTHPPFPDISIQHSTIILQLAIENASAYMPNFWICSWGELCILYPVLPRTRWESTGSEMWGYSSAGRAHNPVSNPKGNLKTRQI